MKALWQAWNEVITGDNSPEKTQAVKTRHLLGPWGTLLAHQAGFTNAKEFSKLHPYIVGEEQKPQQSDK